MHSGNRFVPARKGVEALLTKAKACLVRAEYSQAEILAEQALNDWRAAAAPREEEGDLIATLGKALVAQRKYPRAYDLYMEALNYLNGASYDEIYASFLYLNERMGTFKEPESAAQPQSGQTAGGGDAGKMDSEQAPGYPAGYYDDFEKK